MIEKHIVNIGQARAGTTWLWKCANFDPVYDKENKIFEARVSVPGDSFIVKKQCKSFEEAVDSSVDALKKQVEKHKTKQA
mgnify:CR=1 FL=1